MSFNEATDSAAQQRAESARTIANVRQIARHSVRTMSPISDRRYRPHEAAVSRVQKSADGFEQAEQSHTLSARVLECSSARVLERTLYAVG